MRRLIQEINGGSSADSSIITEAPAVYLGQNISMQLYRYKCCGSEKELVQDENGILKCRDCGYEEPETEYYDSESGEILE